MRRKFIVSLVLIALFLGLGVGVFSLLMNAAPRAEQADLARPPLVVRTATVERTTLTEPLEGFGTAVAERIARLAAEVGGQIVALAPDLRVGVAVTEGQVLVRIDSREYEEQLTRAKSQLAADEAQLTQLAIEAINIDRLIETARKELASTEWEFNKVQELQKQGAAPEREYERTRLQLEQTRRMLQTLENQKALLPSRRAQLEAGLQNRRAEVEIARLNVERCTIRSPFDGRLAEKRVEPGESVQRGALLVTVIDPRLIEVPIELPVSARPAVRTDAPCTLKLPSAPAQVWHGRIRRIGPEANQLTRTFQVFVRVDNAEQANELVPGVFVAAEIEGPRLADVLIVPRDSVQQSSVYVFENGLARKRDVQVERHLRDASIVEGLLPGDAVIVSNLDSLYDGAPVRRHEVAASPAPPSREPAMTRPAVADRGLPPQDGPQ